MTKHKLLCLLFIFIKGVFKLFSQNTYEYLGDEYTESGTMYFTVSYNTFSPNYNQSAFVFTDTSQGIFLEEQFKYRKNYDQYRIGLNANFYLNTNWIVDIGISTTFNFNRKMQMNNTFTGIGYQFMMNKNFKIKPIIGLEKNTHWCNFSDFNGDGVKELIIENKNMGSNVEIKYKYNSYGICPKIGLSYRPLFERKMKSIELGVDLGYHFSFHSREKIKFSQPYETTNSNFVNFIAFIFQSATSKRVPVKNYIIADGQSPNKKIISPDNLFFTFKVGYFF